MGTEIKEWLEKHLNVNNISIKKWLEKHLNVNNTSIKKWLKKNLNVYNISISVCIIITLIALIVIIIPKGEKQKTVDGVEIVTSKIKENEEITEEDAKKLAVKQFKKLGETINKDNVQVNKILRQGEEYYYIASSKNTLEIKILGGEITRLNSVIVE